MDFLGGGKVKRLEKVIFLIVIIITFLSLVSVTHSGVRGTPHDLTSVTGGSPWQYDTDDICVFCHTPHSGQGAYPLWNRNLPTQSFTMYNSPTFDMGPVASISSESLLCMSCHDGTLALNVVYNRPGPDGPGTIPGIPYDQLSDVYYYGSPWGYPEKNIGGMSGGMYDDKLVDDHPISFIYNPSLDTGNNNFPPRVLIGGRYYIDGTLADYPLFGVSQDRFECSSCHSVHHTVTGYGEGSEQVYFLRVGNQESAMCRDCHRNK